MKPAAWTALVAASAMLAAGCTGASKATTSTLPPVQASVPPPDACTVLSLDEVTQLTGAPAAAPVAGPGRPPTTCRWDLQAPAEAGSHVQVEVRTVRDFDRTYEQRQGPPSTRTYKIEPVSGIGDGAYFQSPIDASPDAGVLFAVKQSGNAYQVLVRNDGVGKARIRDIEQALGTAIAARV